jgi:DNA-binding NarL/FixJ family response regulator
MNAARTRLSKRQMEVLKLLGQGKTNKEIAMALFLSPNTIKLHVSADFGALESQEPHSSSPSVIKTGARS